MSNTTQKTTDYDKLIAYEKNGLLSSQIIESSDLAIKVKTLEGIVTSWNKGAERIYGYTEKEIVGKNVSVLIPLNHPNELADLIKRITNDETIPRYQTKRIRKDGVIIDVSLYLSPIKDEAGKIIGIATIDRDVTNVVKASNELLFQDKEKGKRADELVIANQELSFQNEEKEKRAAELIIANKELVFQNEEKGKRADELDIANKELAYQDKEKGNRADELAIANKELLFQNEEKEKRADELIIANKELLFQNGEKEKRADELVIANKELAYQDKEKGKRADELAIANKELLFQNEEKEKRADELIIANKELLFQNEEKGKRADELDIANKELVFQNKEKEKRADELVIANKELAYQTEEKAKRAAELAIADIELGFQNKEKAKREIANKELEAFSYSLQLASQYSLSLIEASLDPLITISTEGKITDMNEAWTRITSMSRENLKGTDFFNYFTEPQKAREVYKEIFDKGFVIDYPLTITDPHLTDVLFNGSVYKDEKGNVLGAVVVARDITSQKQASQYARSIIESSRDPLFAISSYGKIIDLNKAAVNATDRKIEEIIGTDFINYFTEKDKAKEAYQIIFKDGFITDYSLTIIDGILTDVFCNGSVYKDDKGNVMGAVIVARDITEQKRIKTELTKATVFAELATSIAEIAKSKAESATRIAEDAVKAKQQFLSNMSHEIRTPMNAIIGFTKVVLKTDLTAKQKEYLTAIKMSGDALIVLINDILDLAKVDAGKMTFTQTPFKMAASINAMLHLFETKIQEKNLELITDYDNNIPEVLMGDSVRLHQIVLNLVSNAVKFTSKGKITVSVDLVDQADEEVQIKFSVTDTGIGIHDDKIKNIFENFQQASSLTSRLYGGTGLGLAIVKQLVEAQNGSITVQSKLEEGSTFSFVLNFAKTKDKAELETELIELDTEIKNMKVLVVEDMALNQLLMKTLLDDFGFERDIADNGKIAIEKLETKEYDIILMDLQMPEMNGFEATEYIRNTLKLDIPIIALTADVTTVDLAKCKAVGMNDYIAKPVDERLLFSKILSHVKKPMQNLSVQKAIIKEEKKQRCIDLAYLEHRTKADPTLMMEMIQLYLQQTPPLIKEMRKSFDDKDWKTLYGAVHKMIPSFNIVGINQDFENMAKKIQEFASTQKQPEEIHDMVLQLENICVQACQELEEEYYSIQNNTK